MSSAALQAIRSRDNNLLKDLRRLAQDSTAYRKQRRLWLEGDHLCRSALQRGISPDLAVFAESYWQRAGSDWAGVGRKTVIVADELFAALSGLESPAHMGFVVELPEAGAVDATAASVVLDRLQDAGNVGSILRSAAAFGFRQVLAIKGTAALWSPKVLRAGMGAHFALKLIEGLDAQSLSALAVPLVTTSSHEGRYLHEAAPPWPCAWVLGHEGRGVADEVEAQSSLRVRIAQPGGEESLNVAAAAAICLHASAMVAHAR